MASIGSDGFGPDGPPDPARSGVRIKMFGRRANRLISHDRSSRSFLENTGSLSAQYFKGILVKLKS